MAPRNELQSREAAFELGKNLASGSEKVARIGAIKSENPF
jgi:hypothetical protein